MKTETSTLQQSIEDLQQLVQTLEQELEDLQKSVQTLEQELEDLKFTIISPPLFKKGDNIGNYIISSSKIGKQYQEFGSYHYTIRSWIYIVFNKITNNIKEESQTTLLKYTNTEKI